MRTSTSEKRIISEVEVRLMFHRVLDLSKYLKSNSFFLFGPRQTGKSTLIQQNLPDAWYIDLLHRKTYQQLLAHPDLLEEWEKEQTASIIVIDEIQKIPALLDVVQRILFRTQGTKRFLLTGSSARKLKRENANLLGGRAGEISLFPLLLSEVPEVDLQSAVQWGTLPPVVNSDTKRQILESYVSVYLDQEIRAEGLSRRVDLFARFLEVAAICNTQQVVYAALASDVGRSEKTVAEWFSILQDTLVGHLLSCFQGTLKRKGVVSPKFYFFDCGVANAILDRFSLLLATPEYGVALENLVFTHLKAHCSYLQNGFALFYWRTRTHEEVDFIVTKDRIPIAAIEVKSTQNPKPEHFKGLLAFAQEFPDCRKILVCNALYRSQTQLGCEIYPALEFLRKIPF